MVVRLGEVFKELVDVVGEEALKLYWALSAFSFATSLFWTSFIHANKSRSICAESESSSFVEPALEFTVIASKSVMGMSIAFAGKISEKTINKLRTRNAQTWP